MKLANWRKTRGWTQDRLATELGCSQSYVSQIERAIEPIIPGPGIMVALFVLTAGEVSPNDFYSLPELAASKRAA